MLILNRRKKVPLSYDLACALDHVTAMTMAVALAVPIGFVGPIHFIDVP
jgi:hypothetical protein